MSENLINVENVSKKFCLSLKRSLWYGLVDMGSELAGLYKDRTQLRKKEFWALQDISLTVKAGETIGLIGSNGAGKTTLLKLLSGLIKPDYGKIQIKGRLQALIALGAGFNPVLTGRENIYVNAAVLGISKREIDRRFEEIVEFSGIAPYIDTPVQSYSSGMAVRLGFSVAVHMEPDILLIDEVLAVGDIQFRAKCHKKLGEMKERGIPWILVSHDTGTIRHQTDKVFFLKKGRVQYFGDPEEAIARYLYSVSQEAIQKASLENSSKTGAEKRSADREVEITSVELLDANFKQKESFQTGETIYVKINYLAHQKMVNPVFNVMFFGNDEICYTGSNNSMTSEKIEFIEGVGSVYYQMEMLPFLSGIYRVRADIWDKNMSMRDKVNHAASLHIIGGKYSPGILYTPGKWMVSNG